MPLWRAPEPLGAFLRMFHPRVLAAVAVIAWAGCSSAPAERTAAVSQAAPRPPDRHIVAAVALRATGPEVIARRMVEGPAQIDRAPASGGWRLEIEAEDGTVLHTAPVSPVTELRGEFEGPDGKIESVRFPDPEPVVTLRMPVLPRAARLRLVDERPFVDVQGKVHERNGATVAELKWSEVVP